MTGNSLTRSEPPAELWEPSLPSGSERDIVHQSHQWGFSVGVKFPAIFQPLSPIIILALTAFEKHQSNYYNGIR